MEADHVDAAAELAWRIKAAVAARAEARRQRRRRPPKGPAQGTPDAAIKPDPDADAEAGPAAADGGASAAKRVRGPSKRQLEEQAKLEALVQQGFQLAEERCSCMDLILVRAAEKLLDGAAGLLTGGHRSCGCHAAGAAGWWHE